MTTAPIHQTPAPDLDTTTEAILRVLADADAPIPVRDLDDTGPDRRAVAAALARLARQGIVDIAGGHVSVSRSYLAHRADHEDTPSKSPEPPEERRGRSSSPSRR